jgi:hypothetical protein
MEGKAWGDEGRGKMLKNGKGRENKARKLTRRGKGRQGRL